MNDYDVRSAFERIELELIASMKRNLGRHLAEEQLEGFDWSMWQAEQLKTLRSYQRQNEKLFKGRFALINSQIRGFLFENASNSAIKTETEILKHVLKGTPFEGMSEQSSFFALNSPRLDALIKATNKDLVKAEHAMLRRANDQYRKIIFDAEVYANTGAGTLKQAIDMASRDYLRAGINCIEYKGGRKVNISTYAQMAIRTANRRAGLIADGSMRERHGWHFVQISSYGQCSETCLPWQGRVYVDDVYSGGTKEEAEASGYQLLSVAIAGGLFHPNCKHRATTFFPGISTPHEPEQRENAEGAKDHNENLREIQKQKRLATGSLDPKNIQAAMAKESKWMQLDNALINDDADLQQQSIEHVASSLSDVAKRVEPQITQDLSEIVSAAVGQLKGLEYRLKTEASLARKIAGKVTGGQSIDAATKGLHDLVRYTSITDPDKLVDHYFKTIALLQEKGYTVSVVKNTFNKPGAYKGLNTTVLTPDGYAFELQFHTPQSLEIKEINHKLYEEARLPETSAARREELENRMKDNAQVVVKPVDINKIR